MNALDVLARLCLEDGRALTEVAADWQLADLRAVLEGSEPFSFQTRPRGGSKTSDAAAVAIAWLLSAEGPARFYAAAADRDQARLLLDGLEGFAHRTPSIGAALKIDRYRVTAPESGATLEALAADESSSWGLRPAGVILDEVGWWPDVPSARTLLDSLLSSAAKVEGCRVLAITSPSSPSHFAHKLREHAASDALWRLSEVTEPIPWVPAERREEQRRRLSEPMFRRLFLGEWCEAEDVLADEGAIADAVRHSEPLEPREGVRYVLTADLGLVHDRSAVTIAHAEGDDVVVDRLALWEGTRRRPVRLGDIEAWIETTAKRYNAAGCIFDPWQAAGMMQRLRARGVRTEQFDFTSQSVGRLASALFTALRDRRLHLPDDERLVEELRSVRLVERSPGQFRIDHPSGKHDDMTISVALAVHALGGRPHEQAVVAIGGEDAADPLFDPGAVFHEPVPGWEETL
jgi:Terminase large subunit, ATPase domain